MQISFKFAPIVASTMTYTSLYALVRVTAMQFAAKRSSCHRFTCTSHRPGRDQDAEKRIPPSSWPVWTQAIDRRRCVATHRVLASSEVTTNGCQPPCCWPEKLEPRSSHGCAHCAKCHLTTKDHTSLPDPFACHHGTSWPT